MAVAAGHQWRGYAVSLQEAQVFGDNSSSLRFRKKETAQSSSLFFLTVCSSHHTILAGTNFSRILM